MATLIRRSSSFQEPEERNEGDKFTCFGGSGVTSDNLGGAGAAATPAGAAVAAGARDDVLRHRRWTRQGRRPRGPAGRGPALPDAGAAAWRRRQDLARLPQH